MNFEKSQKKTPSLVRYILTATGYSFYFGANLFFLTLFPLVLILTFLFPVLRVLFITHVYRAFLYFLTRIALPFLDVYKIVEDSGFERVSGGKPVIFVANHRSKIDGPVLLAVLKKTGAVMKAQYAKLPVYSNLVKYFDFISVDSRSMDVLATAVLRCRDIIGRGNSLLIFPEGTRSRSARLQTFKDLAFKIAIESGVDVVPLIVHTDYPFMAKIPGSFFPPETMKMVIKALSPIPALANEKPAEFAERVKKVMAEEIRRLDNGTVWERLGNRKYNSLSND
jgi:1-acyl-sn-glycerol-3-phosphate acyltransferase